MPSKSRGGLSKREYEKKQSVLKPSKSTVLSDAEAKKSASSSVSKESSSLAKAQKEYLASLKPSKEENAAIKTQQGLLMGQEQEVRKIQNTQGAQGNTVALPFIERQTEKVASDTEAKVIPLKYQIAALQSARNARGDVAASKARFATESYNRKAAEAKAFAAEEKKNTPKTKKALTPAQELSRSNEEYNKVKADANQRGFKVLDKGVSGPPIPKVLIPKKKRGI